MFTATERRRYKKRGAAVWKPALLVVDWTSSRAVPTIAAVASLAPIRAVAKFFFEGDRKFFVKGVTYGPFKPDAEGHFLGPREQVERDLRQMREAGLNVVRIYHIPPRWFLDCCGAARMRVLITVPWAKHVEFL